ncbi:unnamed protein product [Closterium sp. Naga37s-1]|nr:unnamed protein product [Closterium sp. Naga37s-1]
MMSHVPETMAAWQYFKHGGGADALSLNGNVPVPKPCKGEVLVRMHQIQPYCILPFPHCFSHHQWNDNVPVPTPGKGEVLVRVRAASINPGDWKLQSGLIPFLPRRFPATAGFDLAGNVVAVGPGVTKYTVGEAVFGRAPCFKMGALAQYAVLCPSLVSLPCKPGGGKAESSSNSTGYSNGYCSGNSARVLVTNASGGVGHMAVQLAKAAGAHVTATVGARNLTFARNVLGADEVASSAEPPSSGLYDAVIDCSPNSLAVSAVDRVLRPEGKWVHVIPPFSVFALGLWRRFAGRPKKIYNVMMENRGSDLEVVGRMVEEGKVKVVVESSVAFEESEAWRRSMEGHVTGKLVVRME